MVVPFVPVVHLLSPFHCTFTCQGCDPTKKDGCCDFVLETVAKRMSTKYAHKGVQFFIRFEEMGGLRDSYDVYYLVIQSHVFQADLP